MKFKLEIEIGNDEMQTYGHIAQAIKHSLMVNTERDEHPVEGETAKMRDVNGNTVGKWVIE